MEIPSNKKLVGRPREDLQYFLREGTAKTHPSDIGRPGLVNSCGSTIEKGYTSHNQGIQVGPVRTFFLNME